MAAKKKYYDLESEFGNDTASVSSGFSFVEWLRQANQKNLAQAIQKEAQSKVIENFIKNTPKVRPVSKEEEVVPIVKEEETETSTSEDIVSETLAQIYEEQGAFAKAKMVYDKLILINPEKSDYFAARLQELKKKETEIKK